VLARCIASDPRVRLPVGRWLEGRNPQMGVPAFPISRAWTWREACAAAWSTCAIIY